MVAPPQPAGCGLQIPPAGAHRPLFRRLRLPLRAAGLEVDGEGHDEESDRRKTAGLEAHGFQVLCVPVQAIDEHMDDVMDGIYLALVTGHKNLDSSGAG